VVYRTDPGRAALPCCGIVNGFPSTSRSQSKLAVLAGTCVVLAATAATAGPPAALSTALGPERISAPRLLDLSAPRAGPMREQERPLRLDQSRGTSPTASAERRQFANTEPGVESRPQPTFVIHWQNKPDLLRVARNLRRNGLPVVSLWRSGRSLAAIGLSPRGVPGLYFTQKAQD
jgi:hypothetical protein